MQINNFNKGIFVDGETKESLLKNYISKRPTKVELSDEDIMEEINAVRYRK